MFDDYEYVDGELTPISMSMEDMFMSMEDEEETEFGFENEEVADAIFNSRFSSTNTKPERGFDGLF